MQRGDCDLGSQPIPPTDKTSRGAENALTIETLHTRLPGIIHQDNPQNLSVTHEEQDQKKNPRGPLFSPRSAHDLWGRGFQNTLCGAPASRCVFRKVRVLFFFFFPSSFFFDIRVEGGRLFSYLRSFCSNLR